MPVEVQERRAEQQLDFSHQGSDGRETLPVDVDLRHSGLHRTLRLGRRQYVHLTHRLSGVSEFVRLQAQQEIAYGRAFLFVPVMLGTGAVFWFTASTDPSPGIEIFLFGTLATVAYFQRHAPPLRRYGFASVALVMLGMLLAHVESLRRDTTIIDGPVTLRLSGIVERRESDGQGHWRYIVNVTSTQEPHLRRPPQRVSLLARSGHDPVPIGSGISGRARISAPSGPALADLADFSFSSYFDGIGAIGYFYGPPAAVSPFGDNFQSWAPGALGDVVLRALFRMRSEVGDHIRAVLPGDSGAFAAALVTDERRAISKETTEALRLSGLAHIVAISGLNMALAAGIFFVGLRTILSFFVGFAQGYPVKKIAAAGALIGTFAYYSVSGFAVSAERAFVMMVIMLAAVFFDRPSISLRNIALSAVLILVMSPSEIMGPSFQMSFAATLALVAGYALWKERPAGSRFLPSNAFTRTAGTVFKFFNGIFVTSLIGGGSTAIFTIEHFHRLPTYGLAANLLAMPVISFIVMPAGLVGMLLMPFGLDVLFLRIMGAGLDVVILIGKTVASWEGEIDFGRFDPIWFPLASAGFLIMMLLKTRLRYFGAALMAVAIGIAALAPGRATPEVIISEDGRLVGLVTPGNLASNRRTPPEFILQQWQRALNTASHDGPAISPLKVKVRGDEKGRLELDTEQARTARSALQQMLRTSEEGRFSCIQKAWCAARTVKGLTLITLEEPAYLGLACDSADVVIISRRLTIRNCRSGAVLIGLRDLQKTGSLEISTEPGSDRWLSITPALRSLDRPWTRQRRYDWKSDTFAPASETPATIVNDIGG